MAQKKALSHPLRQRRLWIRPEENTLSVRRQCLLAGVSRSGLYVPASVEESAENQALMKEIDRMHMKYPFYGSPRVTWLLREQGYEVNRKRVERLMRVMGVAATLPGPHTSRAEPEHMKWPYLLQKTDIVRPMQVWCADITYIPLKKGYLYLCAVMDWHSRYVIAWSLSNSMDSGWCASVLEKSLKKGRPEIFNTDQGAQFTSEVFTGLLSNRRSFRA